MSQPLVLAIEPDLRQAAIVKRIVRESGLADVVVVDSRDAAIEALRTSMPDVLLLSALLSPRDEDELIAHLKTLDNAAHLQTHTIPQLASTLGEGEERASRGLFSAFRRKKEAALVAGCDPDMFADEIRMYLERAAAKKIELQNMSFVPAASRPSPVRDTAAAAPSTAAETEDSGAPGSSWASPFEWKPASASKRSAPAREKAPAHHAAPAPTPEPVVSQPVVPEPIVSEPIVAAPAAPEPIVTPPVVEPPSVIKPAAEDPIVAPVVVAPVVDAPVVDAPLVVAPAVDAPVVIRPAVTATVTGQPTIEIIEEPAAPPARVAARTAKSAQTRPKPVADRPAKLTSALLRELIVRTAAAAENRGQDRLGPMARWARTDAPRAVTGAAVTGDDVRSLISSLAVPSAVASVSYPQGVRIRRVRVPLGSDHESAVQASA